MNTRTSGNELAEGITVIIPCYNGEQFLPELLESLNGQSRPADEIIVIDGYSSDRSIDILRSYQPYLPLRIEQRSPRGIYAAWNEGVELASNELCYIVSVDDIVRSELFSELIAFRKTLPGIHLYTWRIDIINQEGKVEIVGGSPLVDLLWGESAQKYHVRPGLADSLTAVTFGSPYLSMMGVAFTHSLWVSSGGFPIQYGSAGDVAWQIQAGMKSPVAYIPKSLAAWRVHKNSATTRNRGFQEFSMYKKLSQNYLPVLLATLQVSNESKPDYLLRLTQTSRQARTLMLVSRLLREHSPSNLLLLIEQEDLWQLVPLLIEVVQRKLNNCRESSLSIPANSLKRMLLELGLHNLEYLEKTVER